MLVLNRQQSANYIPTAPELAIQILDYVRQHGRVTMADVVRATGVSRNTLKDHFAAWIRSSISPGMEAARALGMRSPDRQHRNPGSQNRDLWHPVEVKTAQNKKDYAVLGITTSESWKGDLGEYETRTEWQRASAWGNLSNFPKTLQIAQ
jgi:AraC-like DNA-binding protein